jgi:hypothetical protein
VTLGPIFVFDGGDLGIYPDLRSAEGATEVYDIGSLRFYGADGTILKPTAEGYAVKLEPTDERDEEDLKSRLRTFLAHPTVGLDPDLSDDPAQAARVLLERPKRRRLRRR